MHIDTNKQTNKQNNIYTYISNDPVGVWGSEFDSIRIRRHLKKQVKQSECEAKSEASRSEAIDEAARSALATRGGGGGPGVSLGWWCPRDHPYQCAHW